LQDSLFLTGDAFRMYIDVKLRIRTENGELRAWKEVRIE
jgi:hypothetical protein